MEQGILLTVVGVAIALSVGGVMCGLRCFSQIPKKVLILLSGASSILFLVWLSIDPSHVEILVVWVEGTVATINGFVRVLKFIWKMKH